MAEEAGARAAELLIDQAWADNRIGRFQASTAAAARAVETARLLDEPVLLVRALEVEASSLRLLGDYTAALAHYTQILGLAEDPATRGRLDDSRAARVVAVAHWGWADSALYVPGIPVRELFRVLDAAERWLAATGHRDWRASVLSARARAHTMLGELDAAVAAAEEALAVALQHPGAPGYSHSGHRFTLGDVLRFAGRAAESVPHYQAILADPDVSPMSRRAAHKGLAMCALAEGDHEKARREADAAVLLAESLGDDALCTSLDVLAEACQAGKDLEAAWQAATRFLEAAGRIGGHVRPYYAVRTALDIALDRADFLAARRLLADFDEHAAAMDVSTGSTAWTGDAELRRRRLADASAPAGGGEDAAPVPDDR